jgi:hypothetical protein
VEILLAMQGLTLVVLGMAAMLDGAQAIKAAGVGMLVVMAVTLAVTLAAVGVMAAEVEVEVTAVVAVKPMVV